MKLTQVQKIIKKWQDEMAGAENADIADIYKGMGVDELNKNEHFSYPREVAERMITGELPMDHQSVWDRRIEQGFGDTMYRGHKFSGSYKDGWYPHSDRDMFMSDDPDVAQTYANEWRHRGQVTPLRHNANNLLEIDAEGMGYDDIDLEPYHVPDLDFGTYMGETNGTEGIGWAVKEEGNRQGVRFKNIIDDYEYDESSPTSTVDNILGSRPDVKIRHAELAAYDPEYNGPSIYGGHVSPMMIQPIVSKWLEEDEDGYVFKHGATRKPKVSKR